MRFNRTQRALIRLRLPSPYGSFRPSSLRFALLATPLAAPTGARCTVSPSQIPIAPAVTRAHSPRFPSLKAFGRRPRCQSNRRDGPSSETLHKGGLAEGSSVRVARGQLCPNKRTYPAVG